MLRGERGEELEGLRRARSEGHAKDGLEDRLEDGGEDRMLWRWGCGRAESRELPHQDKHADDTRG